MCGLDGQVYREVRWRVHHNLSPFKPSKSLCGGRKRRVTMINLVLMTAECCDMSDIIPIWANIVALVDRLIPGEKSYSSHTNFDGYHVCWFQRFSVAILSLRGVSWIVLYAAWLKKAGSHDWLSWFIRHDSVCT